MNLQELNPFRLKDAIKFHNELNPKLWWGNKLQPRVRKTLLKIAQDFVEYLGIDKLKVKDITISGSNAAYTYTAHSDIDLHLVVDMNNLNPDSVYRELFSDKKQLYNQGRKITIHGIPVECYVQDSSEPARTLGEYSVKTGQWIKYPTKTRSNFDERSTKLKYEKLRHIVERAMKSGDSTLIGNLLKKISQYRSAGLERGGEFGPENLAYKALRAQGTIDKLYKLRDRLRGRDLSIEGQYVGESGILNKSTPTVKQIASKHRVEPSEIERQLQRGIKVEREHTNSDATAREIALDHLSERPDYYSVLSKVGLEEASGYIPSEKERNDPRFKTALTVDVNPYSIQDNARRLGSKIARNGRPPLLRK